MPTGKRRQCKFVVLAVRAFQPSGLPRRLDSCLTHHKKQHPTGALRPGSVGAVTLKAFACSRAIAFYRSSIGWSKLGLSRSGAVPVTRYGYVGCCRGLSLWERSHLFACTTTRLGVSRRAPAHQPHQSKRHYTLHLQPKSGRLK